MGSFHLTTHLLILVLKGCAPSGNLKECDPECPHIRQTLVVQISPASFWAKVLAGGEKRSVKGKQQLFWAESHGVPQLCLLIKLVFES